MTMRGVQKPPRPKNKKKTVAISKILMAPAPLGPPRKKKLGPMSPRPTGRPKMMERFGKKKNTPDAARGKTTKRGKIKKVIKSILQGGKVTPKVSMKTKAKQFGAVAKKMANGGDLAKMFKTSGRIDDMDKARANKAIMDLAKKLKPTGRLNTDDIRRVREMLRKGKKPVLDSKGKPVKNLTQKAGPGKPMSPEQKKQLRRFSDVFKGKMPKRKKQGPKAMIPLIGTAAKGMRKGFSSKNLKSAAKKLKRIM